MVEGLFESYNVSYYERALCLALEQISSVAGSGCMTSQWPQLDRDHDQNDWTVTARATVRSSVQSRSCRTGVMFMTAVTGLDRSLTTAMTGWETSYNWLLVHLVYASPNITHTSMVVGSRKTTSNTRFWRGATQWGADMSLSCHSHCPLK